MKKKIDIDFFYKSYVDDLYSYARSMGFDQDTSMDAIHDVFYKICLQPNLLEGVSSEKYYLLRALRNKLLDDYRTQKGRAYLSSETLLEQIPFNVHVTIEDEYILCEEDRINKEIVQKILDSLTSRQREIIYLRYLQELDYVEISQMMEIPIHSCRKMLYKTLLKIRENQIPLYLLLFCIN